MFTRDEVLGTGQHAASGAVIHLFEFVPALLDTRRFTVDLILRDLQTLQPRDCFYAAYGPVADGTGVL